MLKKIDVVYEDSMGTQTLSLPIIGATPKDGLLIRKVTGLSVPDVDVFVGRFARDGGTYQGRRVGERNVVLTIDLNPNPALGQTAEALRKKLYGVFMDPTIAGDHVVLHLHEDDDVLVIAGYVDSFEADFFEQENLVQISLICPDPYIKARSATVLWNQSSLWLDVPVVYEGNAATGFQAQYQVSSPTQHVTIENNGQKMFLTHNFLVGDAVIVNTNPGSRFIYLTRNGIQTSILSKLSPTSVWLEIKPTNNRIRAYGLNDQYNVGGIGTLSYVARYWGI